MHTPDLPPGELSDLENRLGRLQPTSDGLEADAMIFAAGQASARSWRPWAAASCLMALGALGLAVALLNERGERLALAQQLAWRDRQPQPAAPPSVPTPPPAGSDDYLHLRDLVLQRGVEALPTQSPGVPDGTVPAADERVLQVFSTERMLEH